MITQNNTASYLKESKPSHASQKKKIDPVDKRYLAFEYGVEEGLAFRLKARFCWV